MSIIIFFCFSSCRNDLSETESSFSSKTDFETGLSKMSVAEVDTIYVQLCSRLEEQRIELSKELRAANDGPKKKIVLDKGRALLLTTFSDGILVCWYGTDWDFNGTSTCPRQGSIACGYFITTTLGQSGFNINRSYLAQQASSVLINTLCSDGMIKTITDNQTEKLFSYVKEKQDGVFLIGLDNHTGYVVKKNGETYFIHSCYLSPGTVVCEPLEDSKVILRNNFFMIGDLSHSDETLMKWIKGEKIAD